MLHRFINTQKLLRSPDKCEEGRHVKYCGNRHESSLETEQCTGVQSHNGDMWVFRDALEIHENTVVTGDMSAQGSLNKKEHTDITWVTGKHGVTRVTGNTVAHRCHHGMEYCRKELGLDVSSAFKQWVTTQKPEYLVL